MVACVLVGLAGGVLVAAGVGSAAGVRVARFTTAITDATTITSATIPKVASPRRSHLADGFGGGSGFAALVATGSSAAGVGEDGSCVTSSGLGASLVDRLSPASSSPNCAAVGRSSG